LIYSNPAQRTPAPHLLSQAKDVRFSFINPRILEKTYIVFIRFSIKREGIGPLPSSVTIGMKEILPVIFKLYFLSPPVVGSIS